MSVLHSLPITQYCERSSEWILAEPINVLSSAAILVSAVALIHLFNGRGSKGLRILCGLLAALGVGSTLHHLFHSPVTLVLDALPIYLFILGFLFLLLTKVVSGKAAGVFISAFLLLQISLSVFVPNDFLNGSIRHLVSIITLAGLLLWLSKRLPISRSLVAALVIYGFAIVFRSVDQTSCGGTLIGTHFLWHIFNALAAYLVVAYLFRLESGRKRF